MERGLAFEASLGSTAGVVASVLTHRDQPVQNVSVMPHRLQDVDLWLVDSLVVPASQQRLAGSLPGDRARIRECSGMSLDERGYCARQSNARQLLRSRLFSVAFVARFS